MRKLDIIKSILQNIINQIDNGTCNMSDDEIESDQICLEDIRIQNKNLVKNRHVKSQGLVERRLIIMLDLEKSQEEKIKLVLKKNFEQIKILVINYNFILF